MTDKTLNPFLTMFVVLAALYFIGTANAVEKDAVPVVSLKHGGKVQGSVLTSRQGHNFYSFRGIPFAEPPVGELRFQAPKPKEPWSDEIMDATKDGPICTQFDFISKKIMGVEDCLNINVYTKELPGVEKTATSKKSTVMVYIFGGGFTVGDGTSASFSPVFLMDADDVVVVIANYRVNLFGFMSTGDKVAPGNYGMLDQTLALKWVQENIETFGGDPDRVLLFGESAGGASVSHHILSPLSKGLFHRAIMMSGSTTCFWAINEDVSYWSKRLAKDVNCPTDSSNELVDCLREKPAEEILEATKTYPQASFFPIPFSPNVDGHFLPDHPLKLLRSPERLNHVPVMNGVNQKEGAFFMTNIYLTNPKTNVTSLETQDFIIDNLFANPKPVEEVTELIEDNYFTSIDRSNETQVEKAIINAISEGCFESCHYQTIRLMAKAGLPTYAYKFEYKAANNYLNYYGFGDKNWGVGHGDDLYMFFPEPGNATNTESDKEMSNTMIKVWTNFAKHGKPIPANDKSLPKWPAIKNHHLPVYHFNIPSTLQKYTRADKQKYSFWTKDVRKARASSQKDDL